MGNTVSSPVTGKPGSKNCIGSIKQGGITAFANGRKLLLTPRTCLRADSMCVRSGISQFCMFPFSLLWCCPVLWKIPAIYLL